MPLESIDHVFARNISIGDGFLPGRQPPSTPTRWSWRVWSLSIARLHFGRGDATGPDLDLAVQIDDVRTQSFRRNDMRAIEPSRKHSHTSTIGPLVSDEASAEARQLWDHGAGSMKYPAAQRSQLIKTCAVATHSFAART